MGVLDQSPTVSVVIAAANAVDSLPYALGAIEAQDYRGDIELVVAAADPGSADVARAAGAKVIDNPSGETPAGLNLAVAASRGQVIVRVDAHSLIPPAYVSSIVRLLAETEADVAGGMQVPVGSDFWERAIAAAMSSPAGAGDARYRVGGEPGPSDTVYLGAFRRETFDELGGYNETFLRHQDFEFNHRVRQTGGVVWFDPSQRVQYQPRASLGALAGQYFQYGRWKRVFSRMYPGSLRPRQMAPPLLVLTLAGSLVGALFFPLLLVVPLVYLVGLIVAGMWALPRTGAAALGSIPALGVMHIAWGLGFLLGQRRDV